AQERALAQSRCVEISIRARRRKFPAPWQRRRRRALFRSRDWPTRRRAGVSRCRTIQKSNKRARADSVCGPVANIAALLCAKTPYLYLRFSIAALRFRHKRRKTVSNYFPNLIVDLIHGLGTVDQNYAIRFKLCPLTVRVANLI